MGDVYEEFEEEEVWSIVRERKENSPKAWRARDPVSPAPRRLPAAARMIPRSGAHGDGYAGGCGSKVLQQSAPVNIPHWSNICRKSNTSDSHSYRVGAALGYNRDDRAAVSSFGVDDDGDDEEGMVPPHEWIARKLARSQISSFSMCEGAGRTLKGRDLSKVRNAVLTRTGFLE